MTWSSSSIPIQDVHRTLSAPSSWRPEPWRQEQHRWSEDYAQKASLDQLYQALELSAVELEVVRLNQKHEQVLAAAGRQVRITAGLAKAGRLLWPAAQPNSRHQAQALSGGAR